jgi:hypothetical protein
VTIATEDSGGHSMTVLPNEHPFSIAFLLYTFRYSAALTERCPETIRSVDLTLRIFKFLLPVMENLELKKIGAPQ